MSKPALPQIGESRFAEMLLAGRRFIDVRAPIEFNEGSIPGAINLPILNDEERHQIGIRYREQGQDAAVALGHELVQGKRREERTQAWLQEIAQHPDAIIYCFRGGLRSQTAQAWIAERGVERPIVDGGYKALRRFLTDSIERLAKSLSFEVVCGPTGSGKTPFLKAQDRPFLDLEFLARHRGSAFGGLAQPQPSQIDFENALAVELLRLESVRAPILIEDESRMIGQRIVPLVLFEKMQASPKLRLDVALAVRVENIFRDYIVESALGEQGDVRRFDEFRRAVNAISKKLGGQRTQEILQDLNQSQLDFVEGRGLDSNRVWIEKLLIWYYDPSYERSMKR